MTQREKSNKQNKTKWTGKVAQWIRVFATYLEEWSLISGTHMVEGEKRYW